ncbi:MAG: flagellin [Methylocella sp.]
MLSLLTTTAATAALAARTPSGQNLNKVESPVPADLANMLTDAKTAIGSIPRAARTLGATTANLMTPRTFVSKPSDSLTTGVGSLVAANMNEAATKLAALQVPRQVGAPALSISKKNTKLILKLFEL